MNREYDNKSRALLDAAHDLLINEGAEALTVRRIAAEADMSTMNLYSRFGSKDAVIDELWADGHRQLFTRLNGVATTHDPVADLIELATEYRAFSIENISLHRLMFRSIVPGFHPSDESVALALTSMEPILRRIESGQRQGVFVGYGAGDPVGVTAWLWGCCHGLISLEVDGIGIEVIDWSSIWKSGVRALVTTMRTPSVSILDPVAGD